MLSILIILSGCATGKAISATGPEFLEKDGLTDTVNIWEDGLRTNPEGDSFEWWYFDASFSDGSTAVIVFFTKGPLNPSGPAHPMVSIVITLPDGAKKTDVISSNEFYASKAAGNTRKNLLSKSRRDQKEFSLICPNRFLLKPQA